MGGRGFSPAAQFRGWQTWATAAARLQPLLLPPSHSPSLYGMGLTAVAVGVWGPHRPDAVDEPCKAPPGEASARRPMPLPQPRQYADPNATAHCTPDVHRHPLLFVSLATCLSPWNVDRRLHAASGGRALPMTSAAAAALGLDWTAVSVSSTVLHTQDNEGCGGRSAGAC